MSSFGRGRVVLKSPREIELMAEASRHTAEILQLMCAMVEPGVSTWDLDALARKELKRRRVKSPFLGYNGFPAVVCTSINNEIVHGIPSRQKILRDGDLIGIDFGVTVDGYVGDSARTVAVGTLAPKAQKLVDLTRACLDAAIAVCTPEHRLSDIGRAVQNLAEGQGYGVVRDFVGHGIGTAMHEDPQVPNYYDGPKPRLRPGLVIAIEPMINAGGPQVRMLDDAWTVVTKDGSLSAHFEDTVAITEGAPRVLSRP